MLALDPWNSTADEPPVGAVGPLRILQLGPEFLRGGIQRHILDLAEHLRGKGHHVDMAGNPGPWGQEGQADFHALDFRSVSADGGGSMAARVASAVACAGQLRRVVAKGRYDLIHSHETAPALVAKLALSGQRIPRLLTFHGSSPERYAAVARSARFSADITACPSRKTLDALIARGLPQTRAAVLGLGVEAPRAPDPAAAAALRRELLGSDDGLLVFSPSRLDPQKGLDVMVKVAAALGEVRSDIVIALAGHGPLETEVREWIRAAGVGARMRVLGPIDTVPLHMAAADLMLLTSRWEALPVSIVEAFHAGLPVVATDCGGVSELVSDDVGRLCKVGDVAGLSAAVVELAGDADLRRRLGGNARRLAQEPRFDPDHVHAEIERLYRRMLE